MSRSTGGDVIPDELFKLVKDDAVKVLHSIRQQIWKSRQWPQDWKRSVFIPIPRKCNAKEWSNYHAIVLISHATKAVLKILLVRLQQYVNREILDFQAGFRKDRKQRSNCQHPLDHRKGREFRKSIYFCFIDYTKAFECVDHNNLWRILKEMEIPE